jgi:hypothetical protein
LTPCWLRTRELSTSTRNSQAQRGRQRIDGPPRPGQAYGPGIVNCAVNSRAALFKRELLPRVGSRGGVALPKPAAGAGPDLIPGSIWVLDFPIRPLMRTHKAGRHAPHALTPRRCHISALQANDRAYPGIIARRLLWRVCNLATTGTGARANPAGDPLRARAPSGPPWRLLRSWGPWTHRYHTPGQRC